MSNHISSGYGSLLTSYDLYCHQKRLNPDLSEFYFDTQNRKICRGCNGFINSSENNNCRPSNCSLATKRMELFQICDASSAC